MVFVHVILTSFNPADPQHLDMLAAMNPNTLNPAPVFFKWISFNAVYRGASHSLIRIGFADVEQAKHTVKQKVFYSHFNKRKRKKSKPRCLNCLQEGHTAHYFKAELMCPYCARTHTSNKCEWHRKMTTCCTACARHMQKTETTLSVRTLLLNTPQHL